MPRWEGKSKGTTLGYRIFVWICKTWGVAPGYILLRFVAAYYFLFSWSSSRHIYRYFNHHHGFGPGKSLRSIYKNYFQFGQTLIDKMVVMSGISSPFTYEFDGEENLRRVVDGGKGGILLSAHVGNWEAAGHLLKRLETRVNIVMFDGEHERIKQYLSQVMVDKHFNAIVMREDMSHVYAINEALSRNELVCLHADRFLEGNKAVEKIFLGAPARFPYGPFALAATFRVPVSVVFAFKESATHYHFFGSVPLARERDEGREAFAERLMERFVTDLEQKVRRYPEQWFNYYNFWGL